jgi:hypothetical protein
LYERTKSVPDRTLRCYLTLACTRACPWCSAGVPAVAPARRAVCLPAAAWSAGINARARAAILAGGEPLLYSHLAELLGRIDRNIPVEIYTNLEGDVTPLLRSRTKYKILASLHDDAVERDSLWFEALAAVMNAGHSVRCHVVKAGNWRHRVDLLNAFGVRTQCCSDQRAGVKSRGSLKAGSAAEDAEQAEGAPQRVRCTNRIFLFGPDGFRYPCVTLLGRGAERDRAEHITEKDGPDAIARVCDLFGSCVACDNNIEGRVEECGMVDG